MTLGKYLKFVGIIIFVNLFLSILFAYLSYYYFKSILASNAIVWDSATEEVIITLLLGPLLETFLFQYCSHKLFLYIIKDVTLNSKTKDWLFIICSSLLFSAMHGYNWLYRVNAFFGGVSLNYSYLYFKKNKSAPYFSVVLIHAIYNLFIFLLKKYLA